MSWTVRDYQMRAGVSLSTAQKECRAIKAMGFIPETVDVALQVMHRWPEDYDFSKNSEFTTVPHNTSLDLYKSKTASRRMFTRREAQGFLTPVGKWKRYKVYKVDVSPIGTGDWTYEKHTRLMKRMLARAKRIREKYAERLSGGKVFDEGTASEVCG